jgi:curved DNA-binding protein CbpA
VTTPSGILWARKVVSLAESGQRGVLTLSTGVPPVPVVRARLAAGQASHVEALDPAARFETFAEAAGVTSPASWAAAVPNWIAGLAFRLANASDLAATWAPEAPAAPGAVPVGIGLGEIVGTALRRPESMPTVRRFAQAVTGRPATWVEGRSSVLELAPREFRFVREWQKNNEAHPQVVADEAALALVMAWVSGRVTFAPDPALVVQVVTTAEATQPVAETSLPKPAPRAAPPSVDVQRRVAGFGRTAVDGAPPPKPAVSPQSPAVTAAAATVPVPVVSVDAPGLEFTEEKLRQKLAGIEAEDFYSVLGVEPKASDADIKRAFFQYARACHPDTVRARGQESLIPLASQLFTHVSEVYQLLMDRERRAEYDLAVAQRAASNRRAPRDDTGDFAAPQPPQAEQAPPPPEKVPLDILREEARQAIKTSRFGDAVKTLTEITTRAKRDYRSKVLLGWAIFNDQSRPLNEAAEVAKARFSEVLEEAPDDSEYPELYLYLGHVYKILGDVFEAEKCYKLCVKHDAQNIDAKRELRLIEMRRVKKPTK